MPSDRNDVPVASVRYAANFASNLEGIESFWSENGSADRYDRLLDALTDVVIPNLQRHPGIGRLFWERSTDSIESERLRERIGSWLSAVGGEAQLREYVTDDYLVLYAYFHDSVDDPGVVQLLAIKHQKQLGFILPVKK